MIISGINISTYGMKLLKVEGLYNLPERKKTTRYREHTASDIKHEAGKVTVYLLGRGYATAAALATAVNNLATLIKSNTVHSIELTGHSETFNGTFADGFKATTRRMHNVVQIKAEITLVQ